MKKYLVAVLIGLFGSAGAMAQDNSFYRRYNLGGMQGGLHLEKTSDGGFVATGQHQDNGSAGGCDIYIYDVDKCGNTLWFRMYGSGGADGGKTIRENSDGGYIVSGHYQDSQGFLMRVDHDGNLIWHRSYSGLDWTFFADQTADGGFIATGRNSGASVFFKTDGAGNVQWARRITGIGEFPFYIEEASDGNYYFTSSFNVPARDLCAGKLDANGNLVWCRGYGTGWSDSDHLSWSCRGIIDETDASMVITSPIVSQGSGSDDILLMKISMTDGGILWSKAIGGTGSDQSRDIEITDMGYAIIGNTNSSPFNASQFPDMMTANMAERDVLLIHVDHDGNEIWSRTYGATGRDKGIGVKFNEDRSFTLSAYTSSPFFGVFDGSFDPLFIRTDTLGIVNCQTGFPNLNFNAITIASSNMGSAASFGMSSTVNNPTVNNYAPNDNYMCQACYTVPEFVPSDTLICVGQTLYLYNTTSIGLTCFQEWLINGQNFPGHVDTLAYVFTQPGTFTVQLFSTCGVLSSTFSLEVHVYEVELGPVTTSMYNGFEVSCPGATDGWISTSASGGYFSGPQQYAITWTGTSSSNFQASNLSAGVYSVTAADEIGCTATQQVVLNEPPPLVLNLAVSSNYNGVPVSCHGASDGSVSGTLTGGVAPYTYSWTGVGTFNGLQATALTAGNYSLTVQDANSCSVNQSIALIQPDPVISQIAVTSNYNGVPISCVGNTDGAMAASAVTGGVVSGAGNYSFQWYSVPAGCSTISCMQIIQGANQSQVSGLAAGNYALVSTDLNGCSFSTILPIADPPAIVPGASVSTNYNGYSISCHGAADGGVNASASGGVPGYSYSWSTSNAGSSVSGLTAGSYTVTVTDLNACSATQDITLSQPEPLVAQVNVLSDYNGAMISCHDASDGILGVTGTGGVMPYGAQWTGGQTTMNATGLASGNYTAVITDANGCVASDDETLIAPTAIVPAILITSDYSGYPISCFGAMDGTAQAQASGGTGSHSFTWTGNIAGANNGGTIAMGAGVLALYAIDVNGCQASITTPVISPTPVQVVSTILSDYNGFPISCFGADDGSFEVSPSGGVQPYSFVSTDASMSDDGITGIATGVGAGSYPVSVADANGCPGGLSVVLIEPDVLVLNPTVISYYNGSHISCTGAADGQAGVNPTGGIAPYIISWSNGSSGNQTTPTLDAGVVQVSLIDLNGCQATADVTLDDPLPVSLSILGISDFNGYAISCHGGNDGSIQMSASGGTGSLIYWANGIAVQSTASQLQAGTVTLMASDMNGCLAVQTVVLNQPDLVVCDVSVLSNYNGFEISCPGFSDGSAAVSSTGGVLPHSYLWSNSQTSSLNNQLSTADTWVQVTDQNNCITSCPLTLNEPTPLAVQFILAPDTCEQRVGRITALASGGVSPYSCTWQGDWIAHTGDVLSQIPAGTYSMTLVDANACVRNYSVTNDNIPVAVVSMQITPSPACAEEEVQFHSASDKPLLSWDWSFGDGTASSIPEPMHIYDRPGSYLVMLTVQDEHKCEVDVSGTVIILPQMYVYVPNSFTPNNDGINDAFGVVGEGMETFHLVILDRWGNQVFESSDPSQRWDGGYRGSQHYVQHDVYVYRLSVTGPCTPKKEFTGSVVVVR